jgi:hypothetical protein
MVDMSNVAFPSQIGNYLLGPQLGSGVSGAFETLIQQQRTHASG